MNRARMALLLLARHPDTAATSDLPLVRPVEPTDATPLPWDGPEPEPWLIAGGRLDAVELRPAPRNRHERRAAARRRKK